MSTKLYCFGTVVILSFLGAFSAEDVALSLSVSCSRPLLSMCNSVFAVAIAVHVHLLFFFLFAAAN